MNERGGTKKVILPYALQQGNSHYSDSSAPLPLHFSCHSFWFSLHSIFWMTINGLQKSRKRVHQSSSPCLMTEFIFFDTSEPPNWNLQLTIFKCLSKKRHQKWAGDASRVPGDLCCCTEGIQPSTLIKYFIWTCPLHLGNAHGVSWSCFPILLHGPAVWRSESSDIIKWTRIL